MAKKMKNMRKALALLLTLVMMLGMLQTTAAAWGDGSKEYYSITLNDGTTIYDESSSHTWLVQGTYTADFRFDGDTLYFTIGKQSGRAKVNIPAGYEVASYTPVVQWSDDSVNSQASRYDCAIVTITIDTIKKDGEDPIPFYPTPQVVETSVKVIHNYYTKDVYTNQTVLDGSTDSSEKANAGDSYTATPVTTYGGNSYAQQTADAALTIVVAQDAASNVITIDYLREIDTTPEPPYIPPQYPPYVPPIDPPVNPPVVIPEEPPVVIPENPPVVIPEEEVPLTEEPEIEEPEVPEVEEIVDEEVPLADIPHTGDSVMLWLVGLLAATALIWLAVNRKRKSC